MAMITYSISPITINQALELIAVLRIDEFKQSVDWDFSYIRASEEFIEDQRRFVRTPPKLHIMIYNESMAIYFMLKHGDLRPTEVNEILEE